MPRPTPYNRRSRGSKLGGSLYCIGDCRKMLTIDQFPRPADNVGVCKQCEYTKSRQQRRPSSNEYDLDIEPALQEKHLMSGHRLSCVRDTERRMGPSSSARKQPGELPFREPRRYRHSTLSSSVTGISDVGAYNSGRSTFGINKRTQPRKKKPRTLAPPIYSRDSTHPSQHESMTEQLNDMEITMEYLQDDDIAGPQRQRKARRGHYTQAAEDNTRKQKLNSDHELGLEGEIPLTYGFPNCSTAHIDHCLTRICKAWNVQRLINIFPFNIWPKDGTLWNLKVLEIFVTMASQYPAQRCRDGISMKFTQLVKDRRRRLKNTAKTQWTIEDAVTTQDWAKHEYGSPPAEQQQLEASQHSTQDGVRSSQRKVMRSRKLIQNLQNPMTGKARRPRSVKSGSSDEDQDTLPIVVSTDDSENTGDCESDE
jgi:hypothetical protein